MNFKSDNAVGVSPEIMQAIADANGGYQCSYGQDDYSKELQRVVSTIFEKDVELFLTTTGTAANALALSALVPPYGAVYCHRQGHINTDECGAVELFTGGAKLIALDGDACKIDPRCIQQQARAQVSMRPHASKPAAISITQATEAGTVYTLPELQAVGEMARQYGLPVHMDGARFTNALVKLGCTPAQMTWKVGVDVLSFGATKNGAMMAEMVIFFNKDLAREFDYRHKRAGQLVSKSRFIAVQYVAYFQHDLWLKNARHANAMAARLAAGLVSAGVMLEYSVDANELFVRMSQSLADALMHKGAAFYQWNDDLYRLVTSFATSDSDIDQFLDLVNRCIDDTKHIGS